MNWQNCLDVWLCVSVHGNRDKRQPVTVFSFRLLILGGQMPFQDVLCISGQRVRKVHVKLHHQIPPLLRVFGEWETLSSHSLSHARLDDVGDLHVARVPVYRGNSHRASAQRL